MEHGSDYSADEGGWDYIIILDPKHIYGLPLPSKHSAPSLIPS